MIINDNLIIANEGYLLRGVENKQIFGKEHLCGYVYYNTEGQRLDPPHLETSEDFEEVSESDVYGEIVNDLIRKQYSLSDELALQRQRDEKPEEFQKYYEYCEECKKEAKEIIKELY